VITVLPITPSILHWVRPNPVIRAVSTIALTWLGISFQLFLLVLTVEFLRLVIPLSDVTWGQILIVAISVLAIIGFLNAQIPSIKRVTVDVGNGTSGHALAQISDVHIGSRRPQFLTRIVRRLNTLSVDAVVITGDLVDASNVSQQDLRPLADIHAPTYFILGNHERYEDTDLIVERLRALGITVMRDECIDAKPFQFIGLDEADSPKTVAIGLSNFTPMPDRCRVLLYHKPLGVEDAARWGAHLMLCGHTHAGQLFPFNFLVKRMFPRIAGSYHVDGLHLYVSPGTGTWGPVLRIGSRSEVTHLHFI
ncbi:MAG: metallophosphoesterase, partial [Gammaproteobacteria bacterium]|nr:metallophosphoesterase [Gammaproteobacteria bacterium]